MRACQHQNRISIRLLYPRGVCRKARHRKQKNNLRLRNRFILILYKKASSCWFWQLVFPMPYLPFRHFVSIFLLPPWYNKAENVLLGQVQEESLFLIRISIIKPTWKKEYITKTALLNRFYPIRLLLSIETYLNLYAEKVSAALSRLMMSRAREGKETAHSCAMLGIVNQNRLNKYFLEILCLLSLTLCVSIYSSENGVNNRSLWVLTELIYVSLLRKVSVCSKHPTNIFC